MGISVVVGGSGSGGGGGEGGEGHTQCRDAKKV